MTPRKEDAPRRKVYGACFGMASGRVEVHCFEVVHEGEKTVKLDRRAEPFGYAVQIDARKAHRRPIDALEALRSECEAECSRLRSDLREAERKLTRVTDEITKG